ncbi:hypothetical protein Tco_0897279 [Tanacetum coccineum]
MRLLATAAFDRGKGEDTFGIKDEDFQLESLYEQMAETATIAGNNQLATYYHVLQLQSYRAHVQNQIWKPEGQPIEQPKDMLYGKMSDHPSPMLDLSLGRCHPSGSVNQFSDDRHRLKQSDVLAFSRWQEQTAEVESEEASPEIYSILDTRKADNYCAHNFCLVDEFSASGLCLRHKKKKSKVDTAPSASQEKNKDSSKKSKASGSKDNKPKAGK